MPYDYGSYNPGQYRSGRDYENRNPTAAAIDNQQYKYGSAKDDKIHADDAAEAAPMYGQNYDVIMERFGRSMPGEDQYFADIQNRQQAALQAAISADRHRQAQADEARGLGGSSVAGMNQARYGGILGRGMSDIASSIAGQRFGMREDRIAQALAFERQKQLTRIAGRESRKKAQGSFLSDIGGALGAVAGAVIPLGRQAPATEPAGIQVPTVQSSGYGVSSRQPYSPYDPYHNSPVRY